MGVSRSYVDVLEVEGEIVIRSAILRWAQSRKPNVVIGGHERPYLRRWFLIPRNPVFNIYVHQFLRSDDDRALHDHPWLFNCSWLLEGFYIEHTPTVQHMRKAGQFKFRWGPAPHRVELVYAGMAVGNGQARSIGAPIPCWTLFITGPRIREWGFYCPQGWVHWKKFTSGDGTEVGRGCDQ